MIVPNLSRRPKLVADLIRCACDTLEDDDGQAQAFVLNQLRNLARDLETPTPMQNRVW